MVKNGWYYCECGQKLFKVLDSTVLKDYVCYCRKCKQERVLQLNK